MNEYSIKRYFISENTVREDDLDIESLGQRADLTKSASGSSVSISSARNTKKLAENDKTNSGKHIMPEQQSSTAGTTTEVHLTEEPAANQAIVNDSQINNTITAEDLLWAGETTLDSDCARFIKNLNVLLDDDAQHPLCSNLLAHAACCAACHVLFQSALELRRVHSQSLLSDASKKRLRESLAEKVGFVAPSLKNS